MAEKTKEKEAPKLIALWKKVEKEKLCKDFWEGRYGDSDISQEIRAMLAEEEDLEDNMASDFALEYAGKARREWEPIVKEWLEKNLVFEPTCETLVKYISKFKDGFCDSVEHQIDYYHSRGCF